MMDRIPIGTKEARYIVSVPSDIKVDVSEDGGKTWTYYGGASVGSGGWFGVGFELGNTNPDYMIRANGQLKLVY
jgi:hypothetical protein